MKTVEPQSMEGFVDERCARCGHDVKAHYRCFGISQTGPDHRCAECPTERRCEGFVLHERVALKRVWLFELDGLKARCVALDAERFIVQAKHLTSDGWDDLDSGHDPLVLLSNLIQHPKFAALIRRG